MWDKVLILFAVIASSAAGLGKEKPIVYMGKHGNYTWPRRDMAVSLDGHIILGALHMVHERSEEKICGAIMPQGGIQALETMLYTLDWINNSSDILPGIKLGILAKDDCDRDIYGMEQAVDFIRGMYIKQNHFTIYKGCSNMNASSFITFFTYSLQPNDIPFWKELFVAFKMAPNIKRHMCGYRVISL